MPILLLSQDLMLVSRVAGIARELECDSTTAANVAQAISFCQQEACQVLVVDLKQPGLDVAALVNAVREKSSAAVPIVACAPHVHESRLEAAREAGCDKVVTRGQFDRDAAKIIGQLVADAEKN